jgi:hypothetical protein
MGMTFVGGIARARRAGLVMATALAVLGADIAAAQAFVCGAGPYRAGCAGRHGAVVYRRPMYYHPYHRCWWRAGVRICR